MHRAETEQLWICMAHYIMRIILWASLFLTITHIMLITCKSKKCSSLLLTVSQFRHLVSLVKVPWNISCTQVGSVLCGTVPLHVTPSPGGFWSFNVLWLRSAGSKVFSQLNIFYFIVMYLSGETFNTL